MTASRALPLAVLGGLLASLLFAAGQIVNLGGMILFWMAPLPLFAVGLRLGLRPLALAGLAGAIAVAAGEPALGLVFATFVALPVLLLAGLALAIPAERSAGTLVIGLTALGVAGFGVACLLAADQAGGLQGAITAAMKDAADQAAQQFPEVPAIPTGWLDNIGLWLPGFFAVVWLLVLGGNGILAYGVLARFGGALVSAPAMGSIAIPRVVGICFAAALVAGWTGSDGVAFAGFNLAEILSVPLLFGGLGVVHALLGRHPARAALLTAFYAVVLGFGFPITVIVALGVIEQWVGLRRRFAGAPRQGE